MKTDSAPDSTDFGFRTVKTEEKKTLVRGVFDSVAGRYDLMNDLMSGGIHRLWKAALMDWLNPRPGQHLLDVAGGTGDIAFRFLERTKPRNVQPGDVPPAARVTVCDINNSMVSVGRDRAIDRGILGGIDFKHQNDFLRPLRDSLVLEILYLLKGLRHVLVRIAAGHAWRQLLRRQRLFRLSRGHLPVHLDRCRLWSDRTRACPP